MLMRASSTASGAPFSFGYGDSPYDYLEPPRIVANKNQAPFSSNNFPLYKDAPPNIVSSVDVEYFPPIPRSRLHRDSLQPREDAAVLQLWEGTILEVDSSTEKFRANLRAKIGEVDDHVGDIHFEWVMDQDRDLVKIGSVFYLTLYRGRRPGGTIINAQELRFRRLPAWTAAQVNRVNTLADALLMKVRARPSAE